ncbi:SGNH/GDSL hydrolase family protein [Salinibacterium sp. SWN139]|uniref:SGNH/GDSL hydrolase family protein n=1 Tax=Salinibacterium sp. SWN139 TaxID=2792055 RepID=UPI0027D9FBBB|nr:SGNH/GDSL hydrolase family protein [Salinibacterium sp. SWN139]
MDPKNTSPKRAIGVPSATPVTRRFIAGFIQLFKPLLRVNLIAYRVETANALFPDDAPEGGADGPDPSRMLFIGDSAASGFGVLNHGLAVVSQTARFVAREHGSGCSWTTMTDTELTMARAARQLADTSVDVDAVVVLLGPPDVLLGTTATKWRESLVALIEAARHGAHPHCPVIVSEVPVMYRFRPMPLVVQRILALQINRLNEATLTVCEAVPDVTYAPFPALETSTAFIEQSLNWKTVHSLWGKELGTATARAIAAQQHPDSTEIDDDN